MAAPTVVSVGTGSETAPTLGTHAAGDIIFLAVETTGGTVTTPTGYTAGRVTAHPTASTTQIQYFYKVAASGSETAPTIAHTSDHAWGFIIVVRGADSTLHRRVEGSYTSNNATNTVSLPETSLDDCMLLTFIAWAGDAAGPGASAESGADVTSLVEQADGGTVTSGGGGVVIYTSVKATAGVCGYIKFTNTGMGSIAYQTIAIAPARAVTVSGTWTHNGAAHADASNVVKIYDTTQVDTAVTASISGGAGGFSALVRYSTHNYIAVCDDGTVRGVSAVGVPP
jgi:hypothetical protein